ncbi:MAG: arylesterase [Chromatiales bacterium]|jgi:acyl-CoA thioesterase-1
MKWVLLGLMIVLAAPLRAGEPVILVVGDSIGAGFGLPVEQGWPLLLERRLSAVGYGYRVLNASVTGDTTRGGLARLPDLLERQDPSILIIELGGNDGLRGISTREMRQNLERMVDLARASGARVLLVGMRLPPNYGRAFTERFHRVYHEIALEKDLALVPFLLEGVATDEGLMQADGIHPNAAAQPRLLDNLWPYLRPLLDAGADPPGGAPAAGEPAHAPEGGAAPARAQ